MNDGTLTNGGASLGLDIVEVVPWELPADDPIDCP